MKESVSSESLGFFLDGRSSVSIISTDVLIVQTPNQTVESL